MSPPECTCGGNGALFGCEVHPDPETAECEACDKLPWYDSYGKAGSKCHAHLRELHALLAELRAGRDSLRAALETHRQDVIQRAWKAASANKWMMFGYWAGIESHLRGLLRLPDSSGGPFRALRVEARRALEGAKP